MGFIYYLSFKAGHLLPALFIFCILTLLTLRWKTKDGQLYI